MNPEVTSYTTGYAEIDGGRLYYESAGQGHALVLLHGFSLDCRMWDGAFERLAQTYHVIRYDLRGFGRSSLPQVGPYAHHEDLLALLDSLKINRAGLLGFSLGGGVALDFVLAFSERVHALVLMDSTLGGFTWSAETRARDGVVWAMGRQAGAAAAKALWLDHPLFATTRLNPPAYTRFVQMVAGYSGWHWENRDLGLALNPPAVLRLGTIQAPTLVMVGQRDLPDFQRIADLLHAGIPGARKFVLPTAGHLSPLEAPEEFIAAVLDFLNSAYKPDNTGKWQSPR